MGTVGDNFDEIGNGTNGGRRPMFMGTIIASSIDSLLIDTQNAEKMYVNILWNKSRTCDITRECYINPILILPQEMFIIHN